MAICVCGSSSLAPYQSSQTSLTTWLSSFQILECVRMSRTILTRLSMSGLVTFLILPSGDVFFRSRWGLLCTKVTQTFKGPSIGSLSSSSVFKETTLSFMYLADLGAVYIPNLPFLGRPIDTG